MEDVSLRSLKESRATDYHLSRSSYHHSSSPQRSYFSSSPQRSYYAHGRHVDDNPVVHFFRNIVTPRTPPPSQPKGGEGHKSCYGGSSPRFFEHHKSYKGYKDAHRDGQGTLSRIFNLGGRDIRSRSASPMRR
ncbi:unnamed protein product [Ranitomeya imitator]|uniref:Myelin basic protein n=1 Tax=Ranitomeya imitator TaxID=111125 RepID=A0ABN9MM82_9NEOB|nr:unnamed protein product [Ranitomeya imitator]